MDWLDLRGLADSRRSVYIHQMNRVNSRNVFGHDVSTINTVTAIIIIIVCCKSTQVGLGAADKCRCGTVQTMSHRKRASSKPVHDGDLQRPHSANSVVINWLKGTANNDNHTGWLSSRVVSVLTQVHKGLGSNRSRDTVG